MTTVDRVLLFLVASASAAAQQSLPSFYWYHGRTIALQKLDTAVAAKVQHAVNFGERFPWLERFFTRIGSTSLGQEPILFQRTGASLTSAIAALASGLGSHEIYRLPVYRLGNATVVVQNEIIVAFKPGQDDPAAAEALIGKFTKVFTRQPGTRLRYLIEVPDPSQTLAWADVLYRNNTVAYAEPNFVVLHPKPRSLTNAAFIPPVPPPRLFAVVPTAPAPPLFPSDTFFSRQWALAKVMAQKAWSTSHGSSTVKIAVLDDGIDPAHPDLKDKLDPGFDLLSNTTQVTPPAGDSHGTQVAGVAAATTNNSLGIAGLAPDVRLIPIRMRSSVDTINDSQQLLYTSNGFDKAIELGADVINCSWTLDILSQDVEAAISAAATQGRHGLGAVIVFAAGDDGRDVAFPANLSATMPVLAIGASNESDEFKTTQSTDGEGFWASNFSSELTVVAPGVHIYTTNQTGSNADPGSQYNQAFDGTSSATPHVAAIAALVLSLNSGFHAQEVRDRIVKSSDQVVTLPDDAHTVIGRVNACRAVGRQDCNGNSQSQ